MLTTCWAMSTQTLSSSTTTHSLANPPPVLLLSMTSLWPLCVSSPGSIPSQLFVHAQPPCWQGSTSSRKIAEEQQLPPGTTQRISPPCAHIMWRKHRQCQKKSWLPYNWLMHVQVLDLSYALIPVNAKETRRLFLGSSFLCSLWWYQFMLPNPSWCCKTHSFFFPYIWKNWGEEEGITLGIMLGITLMTGILEG